MEIAGLLIEKGVIPGDIIEKTFYEKTYVQNQILGRCLMESILLMDGKVIVSYVPADIQHFYGIGNSDYILCGVTLDGETTGLRPLANAIIVFINGNMQKLARVILIRALQRLEFNGIDTLERILYGNNL